MADADRPDLDPLVTALAEMRARLAPLVLARHERRRAGATAGERLTTAQHLALLALAGGPLTVSELAARGGVAVSTATRMAQSLAREGWVAAGPADDDDRRRRPVALTAAGRAVMDEASEVLRARLAGLLAHLDEGERTAVLEGVRALEKAIQIDEERRAGAAAPSRPASPPAGVSRGQARS